MVKKKNQIKIEIANNAKKINNELFHYEINVLKTRNKKKFYHQISASPNQHKNLK